MPPRRRPGLQKPPPGIEGISISQDQPQQGFGILDGGPKPSPDLCTLQGPSDQVVLRFPIGKGGQRCNFAIDRDGVRKFEEFASIGAAARDTVIKANSGADTNVTPTAKTSSSEEVADDGYRWILIQDGEGMSLQGDSFLPDTSRARYLAGGAQGNVWLCEQFVFKRVPVPKINEDAAMLPLCAEVGYALQLARLQEFDKRSTDLVEDLIQIHGVWYLPVSKSVLPQTELKGAAESGETKEVLHPPSIFIAMEPHGIALDALSSDFCKVLTDKKMSLTQTFWDPDSVQGASSGVPTTTGTPIPQTGSSMASDGGHSSPRPAGALYSSTSSAGGGTFPRQTYQGAVSSQRSFKEIQEERRRLEPDRFANEYTEEEERDIVGIHLGSTRDQLGHHGTDRLAHGGLVNAADQRQAMRQSMSQFQLQSMQSMDTLDQRELRSNDEYREFKRGLRVASVPEELLCILAFDVLKSLAKLHTNMFMMHNDIKGGNILVHNKGNSFVLADFGCALPVNEVGNVHQEVVAMVAHGNGEYKAPETFERYGRLVAEVARQTGSPILNSVSSFEDCATPSSASSPTAGAGPDGTFPSGRELTSPATMTTVGPLPPTGTTQTTTGSFSQSTFQAGKARYSCKADIYAFAGLLLELRLGKKPKQVTMDTDFLTAEYSEPNSTTTNTSVQQWTADDVLQFCADLQRNDRVTVTCFSGNDSLKRSKVYSGCIDAARGKARNLVGASTIALTSEDGLHTLLNIVDIKREEHFGKIDIVCSRELDRHFADGKISDKFRDFLKQALDPIWSRRPSADKLLQHPFLMNERTYRKRMTTYFEHLRALKADAEDTSLQDTVASGVQPKPLELKEGSFLSKVRKTPTSTPKTPTPKSMTEK